MLNFFYILIRNRWLIGKYVFLVGILTSSLVLVVPKSYTASSTIMMGGGGNSLLSGALSDLSQLGLTGGLMGGQTDQIRISTLCESRTLKEIMVKKHNLKAYFDTPIFDEALKRFSDALNVELSQTGTIDVQIELSTGWFSGLNEVDAVKRYAADLTNSFVQELDSLNVRLNTSEASAKEKFLQQRLALVSKDLENSENSLRHFEQQYGIISLPDQLTGSVEMSVELARQLIQNEIELDMAKLTLEAGNPLIKMNLTKISIIQDKLKQLNEGNTILTQTVGLPAKVQAPGMVLKYYRLKRDIEIQGAIFKYLTQEYEAAKLDAAKNIPTIQVLDFAVPPYKKSSPKRMITVLLMVIITGLLSGLYLTMLTRIYPKTHVILTNEEMVRYLLQTFHPRRFFSKQ